MTRIRVMHGASGVESGYSMQSPNLEAFRNYAVGFQLISKANSSSETGSNTGKAIMPESWHFWHFVGEARETPGTNGLSGAGGLKTNVAPLEELVLREGGGGLGQAVMRKGRLMSAFTAEPMKSNVVPLEKPGRREIGWARSGRYGRRRSLIPTCK